MGTVKRIAAWVMVVLSVLGIVVVLGGFVGSWIVRNTVTDVTVELLTVGETAVSSVSDGLNRIDARLDTSQDNIAVLENDITSAGETLAETAVVGTIIKRNISDETAIALTEAKATAVTIVDTINALDAAINAANEIPFVNLDGIASTAVSDVAAGLGQLESDMVDFRAGVQAHKEEKISNSVDFLTGMTGEISAGIGEVQSSINTVDARLENTSAELADAKVALPRLYTMITLFVNLLLLLVGAAFVSLLMHSWALAQNPELTFQELMLVEKDGA